MKKRTNNSSIIILLILMVGLISIGGSLFGRQQRQTGESDLAGVLEIYFLDVGQGDSVMIKTPDGYYGLIDAGKGSQVLQALSEALPTDFPGFDFVMVSHADSDHLGGVDDVLNSFSVRTVFWNDTGKEGLLITMVKDLISSKNVLREKLVAGDELKFGCCVSLKIIWPNVDSIEDARVDENDKSLAIVLTFNEFDVFMAGDLSRQEELLALEQVTFSLPDLEVNKINHHGSKSSTSMELLELTRPELVVIPVGKNSYGHPHPTVMDLLEIYGTDIMRTDLHGTVKVVSDGSEVWVYSRENLVKSFSAN